MTKAQTQTQTTAEQIVAKYDLYYGPTEVDGMDIDQACEAAGGLREWSDGHGSNPYRWDFPDGSSVTVAGDGADAGYPECFCWRGAGHNDQCEHASAKAHKIAGQIPEDVLDAWRLNATDDSEIVEWIEIALNKEIELDEGSVWVRPPRGSGGGHWLTQDQIDDLIETIEKGV